MAEGGLKKLVIGFVLVGLFFVAIMNGGYLLGTQNNANQTILDESILNTSFVSVQGNISSTRGDVSKAKSSFENETATEADTGFSLGAFKDAGTIILGGGVGVYNAVHLIFKSYIPNIVFIVLAMIIGILGIFWLWRAWKAGE